MQEFDGLICDECHNVAEHTRYEKVFSRITAPIRIGMTGTLPQDKHRMLVLIGLFAPVIAKVEYQELQDVGLLSTPKILLTKVGCSDAAKQAKGYAKAYELGIVNNEELNNAITKDVQKDISDGLTVLVMVRMLEHGKNLSNYFLKEKVNFKYVHGSSTDEERNLAKKLLLKKEYDAVICSEIFNEGINIPTLGSIINAAGMKSEQLTIQKIGRGLRTAEGKTEIRLRDYIVMGNVFLERHALARIATNVEFNWLGGLKL
jgi:superfamily II DNA or RNA helicase